MNVHSHYENLRVARNAPPEVIRAAYKALSQRYHPDRNSGNAEAVRIMSLLNQAYDVLSDPEQRREFDKWLEAEERKWMAAHSSTLKEPEGMRRPDATRQNRRATFSVDRAAVTKTQRRQRRKYSPMSRNSLSIIFKTFAVVFGLLLVVHLLTSNS
jgi:DnaJ-class molecular chaperone